MGIICWIINISSFYSFLLPFHWPRAYQMICDLPIKTGHAHASVSHAQTNCLSKPNNWSSRHWQITIFCSTAFNNCLISTHKKQSPKENYHLAHETFFPRLAPVAFISDWLIALFDNCSCMLCDGFLYWEINAGFITSFFYKTVNWFLKYFICRQDNVVVTFTSAKEEVRQWLYFWMSNSLKI